MSRRRWVLLVVICLAAGVGLGWLSDWKESDEAAAKRICKDRVQTELKSPRTAKFSDVGVLARKPGFISIQGSVDAQNGFGALVHNRWVCTVDLLGKGKLRVTDVDLTGP